MSQFEKNIITNDKILQKETWICSNKKKIAMMLTGSVRFV